MAATTSESRDRALAELEPMLKGAGLSLSQELFGVLSVLDSNAALRRALTDPSSSDEAKRGLVKELLSNKVSAQTISIVSSLVTSRWSSERDLGDTLEELGSTAAIAVAENSGAQGLDELQAELLGFNDAVAASHDLQWAFEDQSAPVAAKVALAEKLVPNASDVARSLIAQAVSEPRGFRTTALVERFVQNVARRQRRWIATVSVTRPLTDQQRRRLVEGLNSLYGRDLRLNEVVDRSLVGGLRVEVGDEVVDASAATRLAELRRRLAS